jgi:hypothetical protein
MNVETLVREPEAAEAPEETAAHGAGPDGAVPDATAPETPVGRVCPTCGAALADDQDWCLECGEASSARRGALPGWRTAAATIAITLVMASGAVAAAYAALKSDSSSSSAAPPAASAQATDPNAIPAPPPIDIPEETAAEQQAAADAAAAAAAPPPVAPPPAAPPVATPAPVVPPPAAPPAATTPPATTPPATGGDSGSTSGDAPAPVKRAPLVEVKLDPATTVAAAYNPFNHDAALFAGEPVQAFDGDPATAWTVSLPTPTDVSAPAVGLVVDLGDAATKLRRLTVTPTTPGTTIEVYGTKDATPPATLDDSAWTELATQLDVEGKTRITLGDDVDGTGKVRQLLIWFSEGPADGSPSVGLSELKLFS